MGFQGMTEQLRQAGRRLAAGIASTLAAVAIAADPAPSLKLSPDLTPPVAGTHATVAAAQPTEMASIAPALSVRDYRIGPEDLLDIQVFGVDQLSRTVRVNS